MWINLIQAGCIFDISQSDLQSTPKIYNSGSSRIIHIILSYILGEKFGVAACRSQAQIQCYLVQTKEVKKRCLFNFIEQQSSESLNQNQVHTRFRSCIAIAYPSRW